MRSSIAAGPGAARHDFAIPPERCTSGGRSVTLGELLALFGLILVAAAALWSLALAQISAHDGLLVVALALATAAGLAALALARHDLPEVRVDRSELGAILVIAAVAGILFLPGFPYAYVDKDPGVYVAHGFAISEHGSVDVDDPVLESGVEPAPEDGPRFPGVWVDDPGSTELTPQFYHLFPALLATGSDIAGRHGIFHMNPLLAAGAVVLLFLAVKRVAGLLPSCIAAALMLTSVVQVWQARLPSSEILAQLFFIGALFAGSLAIQARSRLAAFVAGAMLPMGFLARPDGLLYLVLGVAIVGVTIALDRADRIVGYFALGIGVLGPFAAWNAYHERSSYTDGNGVPGPILLALAIAGLVASGLTARAVLRRKGRLPISISDEVQRRIGIAVIAASVVVLAGLWFREDLLGVDFAIRAESGARFRTFDEQALQWFSWFIPLAGLVAMVVGLAVVLLRRWRAALMVVVLPGALLLPLYLWDPRITSRMMWWTRRFVPAVLPAVLILIAMGIGYALRHRIRVIQAVAGATAIYLVAFNLSQTLPLRSHIEMAGSWEIAARIATVDDEGTGVFLFTMPPSNDALSPFRNTPAALLLIHDRASTFVSSTPTLDEIEDYREAFPSRPIFLVAPGDALPPSLPASAFDRRAVVTQTIEYLEESPAPGVSDDLDHEGDAAHRPTEARVAGYELSVWELDLAVPA